MDTNGTKITLGLVVGALIFGSMGGTNDDRPLQPDRSLLPVSERWQQAPPTLDVSSLPQGEWPDKQGNRVKSGVAVEPPKETKASKVKASKSAGQDCHPLGGRGVAADVLECTQSPSAELRSRPGHWSPVTESATWVFCPKGRGDMECGA